MANDNETPLGGSGDHSSNTVQQNQQSNSAEIAAVDNSKVKLPDFTEEYIELWFWRMRI